MLYVIVWQGEFSVLFILCRIDIWSATQHITENVAFFLPKNANIDQVLTIGYYQHSAVDKTKSTYKIKCKIHW